MIKDASKFYNDFCKDIPKWVLVSAGTLVSVTVVGLPITAIALAGICVFKTCNKYK